MIIYNLAKIAIYLACFGLLPSLAMAKDAEDEQKIFDKMKSLNTMREALAGSIPTNSTITEETFKAVCKPIGTDLKNWSEKNGYVAKQISHKNRNDKNGVPENLSTVYGDFQKDSSLNQMTIDLKDSETKVFLFRIPVAESCLRCHGEKASRPNFIVSKYTNDKAFDFKVGELRGLYAIYKQINKEGKNEK